MSKTIANFRAKIGKHKPAQIVRHIHKNELSVDAMQALVNFSTSILEAKAVLADLRAEMHAAERILAQLQERNGTGS